MEAKKRQEDYVLNILHSESEYYHYVPTKLIEKENTIGTISKEVMKEIQTEVVSAITPGSGITISQEDDKIYISSNLKGGNGIEITSVDDETVIDCTGSAVLQETHESEKHIKKIVLRNGLTLDEVVDKLLEAIENNGDSIDGEKITI